MGIFSSLFGRDDRNSGLAALMARLASGATPELEAEFHKELLASSLSVPSPGLGSYGVKFGPHIAGEGDSVRVVGAADPSDRDAMLAFTSGKTLLLWRPAGCDTIELEFPELCGLALSAGLRSLMIDAGSPHCCLIGEAELKEFSRGRVPVPAGSCRAEHVVAPIVLEKLPQVPPQALLDALRLEAAAHKEIFRIYLVSARIGEEPQCPLIAMEFAEGADPGSTVQAFVSGVTVRLGGRAIPDVLPLPKDSGLERQARACGLPVWESDGGR